jgi:hypothetical protein
VWEGTGPVSAMVFHCHPEEHRAMFPALLGWVVSVSDRLERPGQVDHVKAAPPSLGLAPVPAPADFRAPRGN